MKINLFKKKITYFSLLDFSFSLLLLLFMWILFAGNTSNADYENYLSIFKYYSLNNDIYPGIEPGFNYLMKLFSDLGLSYNFFLSIYSFFGLLLIMIFLLRYSNIKFIPLILYFGYQFPLDIVQTRNFMATAIFLNSIHYLIRNKKNDKFKYVIVILISSLFHYTFLFYLLFLLVHYFNKEKLLTLISYTTALFFIAYPLIIKLLVLFLPSNKYFIYFDDTTSIFGIIFYTLYLIISLFLIKKISLRINKNNSLKCQIDIKINTFSEIIIKINMIIFISIFLFSITPDFIRLYRSIMFLNFILFSNSLNKNKISLKNNDLIISFLFIILYFISCIVFLWWNNYDEVIIPIFTNNLYF